MGEVKRYINCVVGMTGVEMVRASDYATLEAENAKLRAELERRVVDAITMEDVQRAYDYATDHPHKYLRGTTNWCAAVAYSLNQQRVAAPSAPATVQGVNQQLLEALEAAEKKLCIAEYHLDKGEDDSVVFESEILLARAAIAAARQEGGKV